MGAKGALFKIEENGISEIKKLRIGGIDQYILIQGNDLTKPVLLFLHGGPSLPIPGVSSRGQDYTIVTNTKDLVKHFIVVFWDQRGTGKSYHQSISPHSMTIPQFVSDTLELTDYLRATFHKEKIFLAGHSWGSIIGLMAAYAHSEKYYSYVGLSQIVNWCENDRLSLKWAISEAKRKNNKKALKELQAVGEPPYDKSFKQWAVIRKWQRSFGTLVYSDDQIQGPSLFQITMSMIRSKDYSLKNVFNTFYKGFKLVYTDEFIRELPTINFKETVKKIAIPVTFIHGTKDSQVFGELIDDYYQHIEAENGKRLLWMDKSSHVFHPDDTKKIEAYFIEQTKYVR